MNVPPILLREPAFLELREKLGLGAMHALVAIGTILQSKREDKIKITSKRQLLMSCDLVGDVDPDLLWDCIVGHWLMPLGNDEYSMPLFTEHNKQLLTNWENGKKTQRNDVGVRSTTPKSARVRIRGEFTAFFKYGKRPSKMYEDSVSFLVWLKDRTPNWDPWSHEIDHVIPISDPRWAKNPHEANVPRNIRWLLKELNVAKLNRAPSQDLIDSHGKQVDLWLASR